MVITLYLMAYLIGNIRFAYFCAYLFNLRSPHSYGSKNPGATNISRQNKLAGLLTLILDALKVLTSYILSIYLADENTAIWCSMLTIIGHIRPLTGHGGKGISCWLGCLLILSPEMAVFYLLILILFYYLFNNLGAGSLCCVSLSMFYPPHALYDLQILAWAMVCGIILFSHRSNLKRLINSMT